VSTALLEAAKVLRHALISPLDLAIYVMAVCAIRILEPQHILIFSPRFDAPDPIS
jgi:hypothetical protein